MFPELTDLPYSQRLVKLNLRSLEERRNRADLIEIFKMIKGFSAVSWSHFFTKIKSGVTRGHNSQLEIDEERTFGVIGASTVSLTG